MDETARLIFRIGGKQRHAADDHDRKALRNLDVVSSSPRAAAEGVEFEPDHGARAPAHRDAASVDLERIALISGCGAQALECSQECSVGLPIKRSVVNRGLGQRTQSVVRGTVHKQHLAMLFDQRNRGQELRALQAVAIQVPGRDIAGRDNRYRICKQVLEQPSKQHRVADISHREFIETKYARGCGKTFGDHRERILDVLERCQFRVHAAHEAMEMQALLALDRQAVEKQIHHESFAATDPAVHIEPTHRRFGT